MLHSIFYLKKKEILCIWMNVNLWMNLQSGNVEQEVNGLASTVGSLNAREKPSPSVEEDSSSHRQSNNHSGAEAAVCTSPHPLPYSGCVICL